MNKYAEIYLKSAQFDLRSLKVSPLAMMQGGVQSMFLPGAITGAGGGLLYELFRQKKKDEESQLLKNLALGTAVGAGGGAVSGGLAGLMNYAQLPAAMRTI